MSSFTYKSESHLYGEAIAESAFPLERDSILDMIASLTVPLRAGDTFTTTGRPKSPKRHERTIAGQKRPFLLPVDQAALNAAIKTRLRTDGWTTEPVASGGLVAGDEHLTLRGDFARNGVFIEVEFGNAASFYRDLFKFQIASRALVGAVGVLIVATDKFARFFDSGITTFEAAHRARPYMALGVQMPVWIIGIEPSTFDDIGARYQQMWELCRTNGLLCHDFQAAVGATLDVAQLTDAGSDELTDEDVD